MGGDSAGHCAVSCLLEEKIDLIPLQMAAFSQLQGQCIKGETKQYAKFLLQFQGEHRCRRPTLHTQGVSDEAGCAASLVAGAKSSHMKTEALSLKRGSAGELKHHSVRREPIQVVPRGLER